MTSALVGLAQALALIAFATVFATVAGKINTARADRRLKAWCLDELAEGRPLPSSLVGRWKDVPGRWEDGRWPREGQGRSLRRSRRAAG